MIESTTLWATTLKTVDWNIMMRYFYFTFHLNINSVRKVIIVCIFTGKGKDSEKLNNYPKVTYLWSGRNQIQIKMCQDTLGWKLGTRLPKSARGRQSPLPSAWTDSSPFCPSSRPVLWPRPWTPKSSSHAPPFSSKPHFYLGNWTYLIAAEKQYLLI